MNKIAKNRKALSPVIATIILVAVTVVVSIAVAAWMGALTFSFTKTDQFNVAYMGFYGTSPNYSGINMSIRNTGSSSWSISSTGGQVNSVTGLTITPTDGNATLTCKAGGIIYVSIRTTCYSGSQYSVTLLLTDGNKITYVTTAP